MNRIAIVSNRLPPIDRDEVVAGGLAVGLSAALEEAGGTWFGWDGTVNDHPPGQNLTRRMSRYGVVSLPLSARDHRAYYLGFANRALWPLFHGRTDLVRFDPEEFATYRAVNTRFARTVAAHAEEHDLIWVHDYHFLLVGEELRRLGVRLPLGFFLHTPFPPPEILATLPCHRELVSALGAFDLIGFQTENDERNFHAFLTRRLAGTARRDGTVYAQGRQYRTGVFPIGIDTRQFAALAESERTAALGERLRECFRDQRGIIGIDRLDYTKGLDGRLRAFERMLETAPQHRRRTFLLQIAAPSREAIPEYGALKRKLETISGRINARHAHIDWTPIRYLNRSIRQPLLAALYRLSRVALVTPLRDGMNLVAKEFVAAQSAADPGVLVLSRFAGAAERLHGAVLVDPHDIDAMVAAMLRALEMPIEERRARWSDMIVEIRNHDVHRWRDDFLSALVATGAGRNLTSPPYVSAMIPFSGQVVLEKRAGAAAKAAELARRSPANERKQARKADDRVANP